MNKVVHACICASMLTAAGGSAFAQSYPQRPINFLVGQAPGGVTDRISRYVAKSMSKSIGQPITVENRAGADGTIAVHGVARATDAYTIGQACSAVAVVMDVLGTKTPYDFSKDLALVGTMGYTDKLIVARPGLPANNLKEMIEYARKNSGKLTIGLVTAATNVIPVLYVTKQAGVEVTLVPYKGEAPAASDVVGGIVDAAVGTPGALRELVRDGRVKPIVMLGSIRNPVFPDLQAITESGLQSIPIDENFCVIVAPVATPADVVQKLNASMNAAMKDPELITSFRNDGARLGGGTPDDARATVARVRNAWLQVAKEIDLSKYK